MNKNIRNIALTLLVAFVGISAAPFVLSQAPPSHHDEVVRIIKFEETDSHGLPGLLRGSSETEEENTRPDDFIFFSFLADFHSSSYKVRLAEVIAQQNTKRSTGYLYLRNLCILV
jgi:hypothetical protein